MNYFENLDGRIEERTKNRGKFVFRKIQGGKIHICINPNDRSYLCGVFTIPRFRADIGSDFDEDIPYKDIKLSPKFVFPGVCRICRKKAINIQYGANYFVKVEPIVDVDIEIEKLFDDLIKGL